MWPGFPKRLQSALKALCCLAQAGTAMQAATIAERIAVPKAETAKIMQLLVWGGFVTSRRGIKGGFQLVTPPEKITMGEVIDFFLARHPAEPDRDSPVLHALQKLMKSCQEKFGRLTLAKAARFPGRAPREQPRQAAKWTTSFKDPEFLNSQAETKEPIQCYESQIDVPPQNFS